MKHLNLFENFDADKLDTRVKDLEDRGFKHVRTGLRNDELESSFLYHQIEEPTDEEWKEFLGELTTKHGNLNNK